MDDLRARPVLHTAAGFSAPCEPSKKAGREFAGAGALSGDDEMAPVPSNFASIEIRLIIPVQSMKKSLLTKLNYDESHWRTHEKEEMSHEAENCCRKMVLASRMYK